MPYSQVGEPSLSKTIASKFTERDPSPFFLKQLRTMNPPKKIEDCSHALLKCIDPKK